MKTHEEVKSESLPVAQDVLESKDMSKEEANKKIEENIKKRPAEEGKDLGRKSARYWTDGAGRSASWWPNSEKSIVKVDSTPLTERVRREQILTL